MKALLKLTTMFLLATVLISLSFLAGFSIQWLTSQGASITAAAPPRDFDLFWEVWHIVEREFYGPIPTPKQVTYGAIRGTLSSLNDPSTIFVEPQERELERTQFQGEFEGIGAIVTIEEGRVIIVSPLDDSPAMKAGLRPRDVVLKVDDTDLAGLSLTEAVLLIRGPRGTTVRLTIARPEQPEPFIVEVVRDRIQPPTVTWRILEDGSGYLRVSLFSARTNDELRRAIRSLQEEKVSGLILDLRNNPGGLLDASVQVTSQFLDDGVVLYERLRNGQEKPWYVQRGGLATRMPLVVLINNGTASASEIVAGAIQDHERAPLIGETTFGKGSVQNVHDLSDGSSLHVTIAHWFTPQHHEIEKKGLEPDIEVVLTEEDVRLGQDTQLQRAQEYIRTGY